MDLGVDKAEGTRPVRDREATQLIWNLKMSRLLTQVVTDSDICGVA